MPARTYHHPRHTIYAPYATVTTNYGSGPPTVTITAPTNDQLDYLEVIYHLKRTHPDRR